MNIARVLVQTCNLKSMNFILQSNWNLEWIRAVTGVGAGPAGVVLARPLFCQFIKIFIIDVLKNVPITIRLLQKSFLRPCVTMVTGDIRMNPNQWNERPTKWGLYWVTTEPAFPQYLSIQAWWGKPGTSHHIHWCQREYLSLYTHTLSYAHTRTRTHMHTHTCAHSELRCLQGTWGYEGGVWW